jgi:hypothetical protein
LNDSAILKSIRAVGKHLLAAYLLAGVQPMSDISGDKSVDCNLIYRFQYRFDIQLSRLPQVQE